MNEKPDPRSRLIADLFQDDWEQGGASALASAAALRVRQRRRREKAFLPVVLMAGAAALLLSVLVRTDLQSRARREAGASISMGTQAPAAAGHPGYEIISDDELIADLNDRPLLILGNKQTGRQLVVLQN